MTKRKKYTFFCKLIGIILDNCDRKMNHNCRTFLIFAFELLVFLENYAHELIKFAFELNAPETIKHIMYAYGCITYKHSNN